MKYIAVILAIPLLLATPAIAEVKTIELEFEDGEFSPAELVAPAGIKFKLEIENESNQDIELIIPDLAFELVAPADSERESYLGPLEQGRYVFENALNSEHHGILVVK